MSWRSIKGCGKMAPNLFNLGDYKDEKFKNGALARFQIIGFNHDETPDGAICPVTFDMAYCLPNRYHMNDRDTNQGSWEETRLRSDLNNENGQIYKIIPDEMIQYAEPVLKLTANTYNGENNIITTVDKFFVLSEKELYGRCFNSLPGEGKWYEYYRQEDIPWKKRRNDCDEYVWLRSPYASSSALFCFVPTTGAAVTNGAGTARGVSFCFSL
jgi:hypothetical protein